MIWKYQDIVGVDDSSFQVSVCPYCSKSVTQFSEDGDRNTQNIYIKLLVCSSCGWWALRRRRFFFESTDFDYEAFAYSHYEKDESYSKAVLRNLDLSDLSVPIDETRKFLIARYSERFRLHPKRYEDLVGAVFRDFGYHVRVTAYSKDAGIDIFVMDGDNGDVAGVQVKRYRDRISVSQIREFAGALVLGGLTRGVYVTTSDYTKAARVVAQDYAQHGISIELVDSACFYDRLGFRTILPYTGLHDKNAPYFELLRSSF